MIGHYQQIATPPGNSTGLVILLHGIGEHIGRYQHLFEYFNRHDFTVAAFDLTGHGRSAGPRGYAPNYASVLDDIDQFVQDARALYPSLPLFLYGHSMGGNLVANYVMRRAVKVDGVVLSCPGFLPRAMGPRWKYLLASLFYRLLPGLTVSNEVDSRYLSRDRQVVEQYRDDALTHDRISLRFAIELIRAGKWALDHAEKFSLPLLMMQAGRDELVDADVNLQFARQVSGPCEIRLWAEQFHELHNEPEYEQVLAYVIQWMRRRIEKTWALNQEDCT